MPIEMRRIENALVACYRINEEKTLIEPVMKESYDHFSNLTYGVCIIEISFNDEDLLVASKFHNQSLFIKRYVDEKMVNRILMDDGSAINKTMKEQGILWMNSSQVI
jgi:hypothetical protein